MSQILHLPEDFYARVATYAAAHGQAPEDVIMQATEAYLQTQTSRSPEILVEGYDPADDPLAEFIGAFDCGDEPGWLDEHDLI